MSIQWLAGLFTLCMPITLPFYASIVIDCHERRIHGLMCTGMHWLILSIIGNSLLFECFYISCHTWSHPANLVVVSHLCTLPVGSHSSFANGKSIYLHPKVWFETIEYIGVSAPLHIRSSGVRVCSFIESCQFLARLWLESMCALCRVQASCWTNIIIQFMVTRK